MGTEQEIDTSEAADLNAHQLRMQEARDEYKGMSLREMVEKMAEVREIKDKVEDKLKKINAHFDVLRIELIPGKMEEEGVEKISFEGIGRVSLTGDMNVSIKDKPGYFEWLRSNKLGDLIQETVNASTLKAWVKARVKKGQAVPGDLLNVRPFTRASITKG